MRQPSVRRGLGDATPNGGGQSISAGALTPKVQVFLITVFRQQTRPVAMLLQQTPQTYGVVLGIRALRMQPQVMGFSACQRQQGQQGKRDVVAD